MLGSGAICDFGRFQQSPIVSNYSSAASAQLDVRQPGSLTIGNTILVNQSATSRLSDKEYVTVVVRLLVDQTGAIRQGTVIDLDERPIGQFRQPCELTNLLVAWLSKQPHDSTDAEK